MQNYKDQVKGEMLENLYDLCYAAHRNVSFSPEKRAVSYVKEFSSILEKDLETLGENAGNYKEKFIAKFSDWMRSKGNCLSSMITGPARFPVRKAEKANNAERRKYEEFEKWRDKYFTAINRKPTLSPEDELTIAENRLIKLQALQDEAKDLNAWIRKNKLTDPKEIITKAKEAEYSDDVLKLLYEQTKWDGEKSVIIGYKVPSFTLTNNNAKIKSTIAKVKTMLNRIETKENFTDIEFPNGRITIEDDRIKIFNDEKPEKEIIELIKSNGFRWSPFWKCWCRKHTENAMYVTKKLLLPKLQ